MRPDAARSSTSRTSARERTPSYCPVGDGAVGYEHVVPAAVAAGVEWLLVEQDEVDGSELDAAERSLAALEGFVGVAA